LEDAEEFFALPHEARLAKVRSVWGAGEEVTNLISYAVEHQLTSGIVSEMELLEILFDYLNNPEFKAMYVKDRLSYDGFDEHLRGKDIEALWNLVLKVPESLSHVIIEHLPESAGLSTGIPKHVLYGMSDRQLQTLFYRSDIGLEEFRRQKFFETVEANGKKNGRLRDGMQCAAATYAFDLTNDEFGQILSRPGEQRVRILTNLS
jgi:hypothetical protein